MVRCVIKSSVMLSLTKYKDRGFYGTSLFLNGLILENVAK